PRRPGPCGPPPWGGARGRARRGRPPPPLGCSTARPVPPRLPPVPGPRAEVIPPFAAALLPWVPPREPGAAPPPSWAAGPGAPGARTPLGPAPHPPDGDVVGSTADAPRPASATPRRRGAPSAPPIRLAKS